MSKELDLLENNKAAPYSDLNFVLQKSTLFQQYTVRKSEAALTSLHIKFSTYKFVQSFRQ